MIIPLTAIEIKPSRFRQEFREEDIIALAESIHTLGQIHPIRVERIPDSKDEASGEWRYYVISGERRYRALCWLRAEGRTRRLRPDSEVELPYDSIWAEPVYGHTELLAKEMELDENLKRVNLTWQEVASATAELHDIRKAQHDYWTVRMTAEEIQRKSGAASLNATVTRNRILLAENLHRPELRGIQDEKAAFRTLEKLLEKDLVTELGKRMTLRAAEHDIRCVDALEGMRSLPDGSVNCICTDPPYGIDADKFNVTNLGTGLNHIYNDSPSAVRTLMEAFFPEAYRVCAPRAHMYVFCDQRMAQNWRRLAEEAGWQTWPWFLIWVKNQGVNSRPDFGPRHHYETILYFNKGEKHVYEVESDVITCPIDTEKFHAAQKPVPVYTNLLRRSVIPGNVVLDPFCGSGPIVVAAKELKCKAIAFDLDEANVSRTKLRAGGA